MTFYLIAGIFFIFLIGYLLSHKILPASTFIEKIALSFSLGLGSVVSILAVLLFLGILYSPNQLLIILAICSLLLHLGFKSSLNQVSRAGKSSFSLDWNSLAIAILAIISFIISTWYPTFITDGNDYEMTGKLISLNKSMSADNYLRSYPPLVMLSFSFVYFLGGTNPKFIFSLLYISLCIVFYWRSIDLGVSKKLSSLVTLMLGSTPIIWWHSFLGLLNLTASYYFVCASLFWFSYLNKNLSNSKTNVKRFNYLILAGIFYGLSIFTRSEFLMFFLIPLIQVLYYHKDSKNFKKVIFLFMLPPLFYGLIWGIYFTYLYYSTPANSSHFSPVSYLFLLSFVLALPFLFNKFIHLDGIQNIVKIFKKNILHTFYIILPFLIFPILSYLIIELTNLPPDDNILVKSLFILKVFAAIGANSILCQIYFSASIVIIIMTLPLLVKLLNESSIYQYLLTFSLAFFIFDALIFSIGPVDIYPLGFSHPYFYHDIIFLIKTIISYPGMLVNNTQTRSFIAIFPILLLITALVLQNKDKAKSNIAKYYKSYHRFLCIIVLLNLIILVLYFMVPRLHFMVSHWGESRNQLLLSSGPKDNPNMAHLRKSYEALIEVEDQSRDDYPVFLINPKFSKAEALKILFPRKVYFGAEEAEYLRKDIKEGEIRPDCYSFSFIGQKQSPVNIDRQLCRNFKHITIEKSESHLSRLKELQ